MMGDTSHCRPQSTAEMNHHQYSTTTNFVPHTDILCSLTVSLNRCGTHQQHTLCYLPRSCTNVCSVSMLVFISTDMEWVVQCLHLFTAFSTPKTFFRLMTISACPSHGMFTVCLSNIWGPIHHHYISDTCSTTVGTSAHKFRQTDILLLKENELMPSGHLDGFGICTPS